MSWKEPPDYQTPVDGFSFRQWFSDLKNQVATFVPWVSILRYGALRGNTNAQNKAALQAAIAAVDAQGGGAVVVPGGIHYGFELTTPSTKYPDFSDTSTDVAVIDLGPGYADPAQLRQGAQVRLLFHTQPTADAITFTANLLSGATSATLNANWALSTGPYRVTFSNSEVRNVTFTNGAATATWTTALTSGASTAATFMTTNHNGNVFEVHGDWHPGIVISNDSDLAAASDATRLAHDNRRGSIVWMNDGRAIYRFGVGALAGHTYTDEELSDFVLEHYQQATDALGNYALLVIRRQNGRWCFNRGSTAPPASFDFYEKTTGLSHQMLVESLSTACVFTLRNSDGSGDDVQLKNSDGDAVIRASVDGVTVKKTSGNVLVGGTTDNSVVVLNVQSTTKVFAPPRMTEAQRDAISGPPSGSVIYNTTSGKLNLRGASAWEEVTSA